MRKMISILALAVLLLAPVVSAGSGDPLKGLRLPKGFQPSISVGNDTGADTIVADTYAQVKGFKSAPLDEEKTKKIITALNDVVQAQKNYIHSATNTYSVIGQEIPGYKQGDDTLILKTRNALYEPIDAADATVDAIDQAMVDFPLLEKIFGNERMNAYIGGQAPFNIVTSGGKVESLGAGEIGNPSMKVYADIGTINQLIAGELTPLDALQQGKIKYTGVGVVKAVKFKVLGVVARLGGRIINVIKEVKIGTP